MRNWTAHPTIIPSEAEANVNVTFDPAPNCYNFSAYEVSLVDYNSGDEHLIIKTVTVYHPSHPRNNVCFIIVIIIIILIIVTKVVDAQICRLHYKSSTFSDSLKDRTYTFNYYCYFKCLSC